MMTDSFEKAKECAFWYINKRRYTKHELMTKLVERGYDNDLSKSAVEYLEENGYVDDYDYVCRYIHDAVKIKKRGLIRIKNDLKLKGIDGTFVEKVFYENNTDTEDVLYDLVCSKAPALNLDDIKQYQKLVAFLIRRGFNYSEISKAISSYRESKGEI